MGGFAGLGERSVWAVPFGVVDVVAGGASFAVAALATVGAMQHDLVRASSPVLVNEKCRRVGGGSGRLRDESNFGDDSLQLRARIAAHGEERETIDFLDFTHHGERGFYWQRARLDEVGLHQWKIFAIEGACGRPVVGESCAG
jgi:hypothetical protein